MNQTGNTVIKELKALERKYRALELENRRFSEETEGVIRKQRLSIEALTSENKRLSHDFSLIKAVPRDVEHRLEVERQNHALGEIRLVMDEIRKAEGHAGEVEHSITLLRSRLSLNKGSPRPLTGEEVDTRVEALEARLHNSIVKFNETVAANAELRSLVDSLRQEKANFSQLEAKATEDIENIKQRCLKLMEEINSNYAGKDKAIADLQHLRTLADREHFEFDEQLRSLVKLLESDVEHHRPKDFASAFEPVVTEELRQPAPTVVSTKLEEDLKSARNELERFEYIFERIKAATGFTNIDDLVESFQAMERSNYSLFARSDFLMSELCKIEALRDHVNKALSDITQLALAEEGEESGKTLESNLEKIRKIDEKIFEKNSRILKISNHFHSILSLFNQGTARSSFTDLLEGSDDSIHRILSRIDSMLDKLVGPNFRQMSHSVKHRRSVGNVNFLSLPSSMRPDSLDNQVTGDKLLSREEIMKLATTAPIRAVSAASTRPSTNHKISRKPSVVLAAINDSL